MGARLETLPPGGELEPALLAPLEERRDDPTPVSMLPLRPDTATRLNAGSDRTR